MSVIALVGLMLLSGCVDSVISSGKIKQLINSFNMNNPESTWLYQFILGLIVGFSVACWVYEDLTLWLFTLGVK